MPAAERLSLAPLMMVTERAWSSLRLTRDRASATCRRLSATVIPRQAARESASVLHTVPPVCSRSVPVQGTALPLWQGSESRRTCPVDQGAISCRVCAYLIPVKSCAVTVGQSHPLKRG